MKFVYYRNLYFTLDLMIGVSPILDLAFFEIFKKHADRSVLIAALILIIGALAAFGFRIEHIMIFGTHIVFIISFSILIILLFIYLDLKRSLTNIYKDLQNDEFSEDIKFILENHQTITTIIASMSVDLKGALSTMVSMNNKLRGIPSKSVLKNLLMYRTRLLFYDYLECIIDYTSAIDDDRSTLEQVEINFGKANRSIVRCNQTYITDLYLIAKGTLKEDLRPIVNDYLNEVKKEIEDILKIKYSKENKSTEKKLYTLLDRMKEVESFLLEKILENLTLTTFLPYDEEERDS